MNEECRNKDVNGFVDQGGSKTDSDNHIHSERASLEAHQFPEGGFRAWLVVSGSAATMFSTFGYLTGFGIYQQWYGENQLKSYTQSDISWIGSVQIFLTFSGGLVGGPILDRYGSVALLPVSIIYVVSLVLTSFCKEYYQFFLAQAVLGGICLGFLFSNALTIIGHYFDKRYGLASGIVMAGAALGGVVFPVALNRLLNDVGLSFGWSVRICALVVLVLLTYANLTMKPRLPPTKQNMDLSLMKRPIYILVAIGGWLFNWGLYIPLFYLPSFATTAGLSAKLAPHTVAIFNAVSIFGRVIAGALADRMGCFNVVVINGLLCAITLFVWAGTQTAAGVLAVTVFEGLFIGSIVSLQAAVITVVTPDPKNLGSMIGFTMAIWACGGLTGPPIAGAILSGFDGPGSYSGPGYFGGASLVAGSAFFFASRLITEKRLLAKV
ncbi:riboflavin transporter MCH5 [Diaporthe amygdali]|uniref:riboflavin transporter MCH5 n=1 Tax=Phomopsis amygdali TaxID=1214568 RepID=UPI0022FF24B3|nr:riboflavin transporter MCH5 [Diaporthe amygdali]KAJ0118593.1 riboflavin transporter MCH5 [Diaporthe amygdali]